MSEGLKGFSVAVAGDLRGHLIGTVSKDSGTTAIANAEITITGSTPLGEWSCTTTTDSHGYFESELPFGTLGALQVAVAKDGERTQVTLNSSDIARGLTPRPRRFSAYRLSLEGEWDFAPNPDLDFLDKLERFEWRSIKIPSHWEMAGIIAESGVALYQRSFEIPSEWSSKRIKFRADGIYSRAEIWLNS